MIEDSRGNQFEGDLSSLFKQMSGKTVSQPVPDANKGKDNSAVYKEMGDLLKKLNANFNTKELSGSIEYLNRVIQASQASQNNLQKTLQGDFKNLGDSLSKLFGGFGNLQQEINKISGDMTSSMSKIVEKTTKSSGNSDLKSITTSMAAMAKEILKNNKSASKSSDSVFAQGTVDELSNINATEQAEKGLRTRNYSQLSKLADAGLRKGSMHTSDDKLQKEIKTLNRTVEQIRDAYLNSLNTQAQNQTQTQTQNQPNPPVKGKLAFIGSILSGMKNLATDLYGMAKTYGRDLVTGMNRAMAVPNFMENALGGATSFKDALTKIPAEQRNIAIQAKQIAYETDGITGATKGLQAEYLANDETAKRTGVSRLTFQQKLLEFQRKGLKDQTALKEIVTAQLTIEKQLGMEAGELGDDFIKLNQQAGFTNNQIASTARGMLDVARQSGLSGKELKAAMDSSKGILESMKNAATLTSGAIKNVTAVMAEAQKLGVTDQVSTLMQSAASSSKLFLSTSTETKNLLYQAAGSVGRISDLQNGILTKSKAGLKDLGSGMDNVLKRFGVDGVDAIENLSDEAKARLNIQLQSVYKMDLGEFTRTAKAIKDGAKGYNDRLKEINDKLKENGDTAISNEERKALELKKASLQQQASMDILTKFDESLKGAGTGAAGMQKGMQKFNAELTKNKDLQDQISGLAAERGIAGPLSTEQQVGLGLDASIANLNKKMADLKMDPSKQIDAKRIQAALADPKQFKDLVADMEKMQQETMTAEKAASDPVFQAQQKMLEYNDKISIAAQISAEKAAAMVDGQMVFASSMAEALLQGDEQTGLLASIEKGISYVWGIIASLPSMFTGMVGKFASGVGSLFTRSGLTNAITGLGKRIPLISGIVDAGTRLMEGQSVTQAATGGASTFAGAAGGAALGTMVAGPIGTVIGGIIGAFVGSGLGDIAYEYMVKPFIELLPTIWTKITEFFGWIGPKMLDALLGAIWGPIKFVLDMLGLTDLLNQYIWQPMVTLFTNIGSAIWDWVKPIWNSITGIFGDLANWFGGWGSKIWDFLYKGASAVGLGWLLGKGEPPKGATAPPSEKNNPTAMAATSIPAAMPGMPSMPGMPEGIPALPGMPTTPMAVPTAGPFSPTAPAQTRAAMARTTTSGADMSPYLASIARSSETEVNAAQQMIQLLQKMVEVLSTSGGGPKPAFAGATTPRSDNVFKLPTGNFNESSIREVTNL